ncbi:hypothetical protein NSZ01_05100 [Nocardioides szechwanensis]|uniref:Uncharacterized protein n=1 Tax=Nocardioides szechwanensis TaxID=1005944 RepID=A0A1G9W5Q9_9ACTN|nr:hypothetical protein [Nocardioides szechwanensis]GEP32742.1 hypothetical protein NSZ01_05100 [Nocardioides szechwanensis]SDM79531.1 hypothetical protein SAMN05192576_0948 [Nocardioides szechwanensis]
MTTKSTKTIKPTETEQLASNSLDAAHEAAVADLASKRTILADLMDRLAEGDSTVTGAGRSAAEADVTNAEALLVGAEARRDAARLALATAIAETVADEIAHSAAPVRVPNAVAESTEAVSTAISNLLIALRERDEASDGAGQRLAAAGVPQGEQVGRIRYLGVSANGMGGRRSATEFNVNVDGVWLSARQGIGHTRDEGERLVKELLETTLRENGLQWTTTGLRAI